MLWNAHINTTELIRLISQLITCLRILANFADSKSSFLAFLDNNLTKFGLSAKISTALTSKNGTKLVLSSTKSSADLIGTRAKMLSLPLTADNWQQIRVIKAGFSFAHYLLFGQGE